jgi:outer membrane protein assembly factor BamB
MKKTICIILLSALILSCKNKIKDQIWPQFRGINGSGVAAETARPPVIFDSTTLSWKAELPQGVSSPVIWKNKLFVTGFNDSKKELQTICLNRKNGNILWTSTVVPDTIEICHSISSPAQSSVVTDGERVITYFGSCGLYCYDMQGKLLWKYQLACSNDWPGSGTSPVIADDKLILIRDSNEPFLLALYLDNGTVAWKKNLNNNPIPSNGGHSVPCIYKDWIFVHRVGEVTCYSIFDGSQIWSYKLLTSGVSSPIVAGDKVVTACWYNFSEENQRGKLPGFDDLIKYYDKNQNGTISETELPDDMILFTRPEITDLENTTGSVRNFMWYIDTNQDGEITRQEWDNCLEILKDTFYKPAGLLALNLENKGELYDSSLLWRVTDNIPEVPSPVFYQNRIYMVKDGGIVSCVDPENGRVIYSMPLGNRGGYIASPVVANGNVYIFSLNGKMKILKTGDKFEIAGEYDFKDKILATPAIIGNNIYIRTRNELLAYSGK